MTNSFIKKILNKQTVDYLVILCSLGIGIYLSLGFLSNQYYFCKQQLNYCYNPKHIIDQCWLMWWLP